ncbi:MAG: arsenic transporter ATPase [Pseudonocardiales bacterium]|nr:arsenic transporter ATPase [Pseudonocardiales bacterium]
MRIVFFTGKGGVGKTTTAAATALRSADRGVKTLIVSTDAAHSLGDALGMELGNEPVVVSESLSAVQVDAQARFESSWSDVQRYLLHLLAAGGVDPITADELTVLPGIEEVLSLLAVRDLVERDKWDAIVVDCAPTAETLRLLALPDALAWYLERVLPMQRRLARGVRPMAALLGARRALPPDGLFDALVLLADEVAAVRALLADPAVSTVRLVLTPETVVVAEARRTFTALALYGYQVDGIVANRVIEAGDGDPWRAGWAAAHQRSLAEIRSTFSGITVREATYRTDEPIGVDALREVGDDLYADLGTADPLAPVDSSVPIRVHADNGEYVLTVPLPLADPSTVEAVRSGDELVLTVAGHRRVLALPSVLRRCLVVSGSYEVDAVEVRFRPDPALWPQTRSPDDGTGSR